MLQGKMATIKIWVKKRVNGVTDDNKVRIQVDESGEVFDIIEKALPLISKDVLPGQVYVMVDNIKKNNDAPLSEIQGLKNKATNFVICWDDNKQQESRDRDNKGTGTSGNRTNNDVIGANMVGGGGAGDKVAGDNVVEEGGVDANITGRDKADAGPGTFRNGTNNDTAGGNMVDGDGTSDDGELNNAIDGPTGPTSRIDETPQYTELTNHILPKGLYISHNMPEDIEEKIKAITIIIQACNENELIASAGELILEGDIIQVEYIDSGIKLYLGKFANCPCGLVVTRQGIQCKKDVIKILDSCINARLVIGIGVTAGLGKAKLGDVLIATQIAHFDVGRVQNDGFLSRGETKNVSETVENVFSRPALYEWDFQCTRQGRKSKCISGLIASGPYLLDSKLWVDKIALTNAEARGYEMEGHILQEIAEEKKDKKLDFVIIKGVCDFANGTKSKEWQYTAAKAAASYTKQRLNMTAIYRTSEPSDTAKNGGKQDRPIPDGKINPAKKNIISEDVLDESDLTDIMDDVVDVAFNWKLLGQALRLNAAELDTIGANNPNQCKTCLQETIKAWLNKRYDFQKYGSPSWKKLCEAIKARAGGNNPGLATKIAEKHRV